MQLKSFTQQTLFYGLSSLLPRLLLFVLNPLFSYNFPASDIGIITLLYSTVIFVQVLLTFGLETGVFYFSNKDRIDSNKVFATAFNAILLAVFIFILLSLSTTGAIASLLKIKTHPEYIRYIVFIVACDILCTIPYAWLRMNGKAWRYSWVRFSGVIVNFLLCILFIWVLPRCSEDELVHIFGFSFEKSIHLVFMANLIGAAVPLILLFETYRPLLFRFDAGFARKLFLYSLPIMFTGLVTTVNDITDRFFLLYCLPSGYDVETELGLYGSNLKLAVIMAIFVQVFRLTAEPYFFKGKFGNAKYAIFFKYFTLYGLILFIVIVFYLDVFKYWVGPPEYWVGLSVVPVYLLANLFMGLYFNMSFWYKLSGRTALGTLVALGGLFVSVVLNLFLVPRYSYFACAWSHLAAYFTMFMLSWLLSRKYSKLDIAIAPIFVYILAALVVFLIVYLFPLYNYFLNLARNTLILFLILIYLEKTEKIFSILYKKENQSIG